MDIKNLFSGKGLIEKAVTVIDKLIPDKTQANSLKFEIYKIIASSQIAKYVRALIAIMFFTVWLFFPEKLAGREEMTKYMIFAIAGYYFIVDRGLDGIKKK